MYDMVTWYVKPKPFGGVLKWGCPQTIQSLDHFSIETRGDLDLPHSGMAKLIPSTTRLGPAGGRPRGPKGKRPRGEAGPELTVGFMGETTNLLKDVKGDYKQT
jgi:hypothetical protein